MQTHLHIVNTMQCKAYITQQDTHAPSLASHVAGTMKAEFKESALEAGMDMCHLAKMVFLGTGGPKQLVVRFGNFEIYAF